MGSVLGLKRSERETDHFVQRGVKVRSSLNFTPIIACDQTEAQHTFCLNSKKLVTYKIWWLLGLGSDYKIHY
jgi:hypothetical protein